jgi:hypothetical protein
METKEELIGNIKEWIKMDNEIAKLKVEIKERNNKKKLITDSLVTVMKKNDIDCFDINGGSLVYKKSVVKKPLNGKTIINALQTFYQNTPDKAEEVTKFLLENREEEVKETIRRKIVKTKD